MNSIINTIVNTLIRSITNRATRKLSIVVVIVIAAIAVTVKMAAADVLWSWGDQTAGQEDGGYGLGPPTANGCWSKSGGDEFSGTTWVLQTNGTFMDTQGECSSFDWAGSGWIGARFNGVGTTTTIPPTTTTTSTTTTIPPTTTTSTTTTIPPTTTTSTSTTTTSIPCNDTETTEQNYLCAIAYNAETGRAEILLGMVILIILAGIAVGMRVWR